MSCFVSSGAFKEIFFYYCLKMPIYLFFIIIYYSELSANSDIASKKLSFNLEALIDKRISDRFNSQPHGCMDLKFVYYS